MGRLEYVDPRYVSMTGDTAVIERPFKAVLDCQVLHVHAEHCSGYSRSLFLDPISAVLYCTDRGLKGGGTGKSKAKQPLFVKEGPHYETNEQQRALERLEQALKHSSPALAFQCCAVLFDCATPTIMMRVVDIVTKNFKVSDTVWAWGGTHGHLARIHCARLLRIAAVRVKMAELEELNGIATISSDQKAYSEILEGSVKRIVQQAKTKREIVLQAELRASWAVISSLKNERDARDWLKDYGPSLASLASLLDPYKAPGLAANAVVTNIVHFYNLLQKARDRSLSQQILLIAVVDFSVTEVTLEAVNIVKEMVVNCRRWVTAVLCTALIRKWLQDSESLSKEVFDACIEVLELACSFKIFVFRSNWKVRCGGLWNVVALHETTRLQMLKLILDNIIQMRKTMEKDVEVLGTLELMDTFRSASVYLSTQEVYGSVLERELHDISEFINMSRQNINTEQSEKDGKNYQAIIKKELEKVSDTYKEMAQQGMEILKEVKYVKELINSLHQMVSAQAKILKELQSSTQEIPGKIVSLPKMTLADECFHGRLEELRLIKVKLGDANEPKSIALVGPESMGKSWLAIKYAKLHIEEYDTVAYLQADSASSIFLSLIALAKDLHCVKCSDKETLESVKRELAHRPRTLLIYDNADFSTTGLVNEVAAMMEYMSLVFAIDGHILLTSRSTRWAEKMDIFEVGGFSESEAITLIHDVGEVPVEDSRELARVLDCEPLAVKQAASLLKRKQGQISELLTDFRGKRASDPTMTITTTVLQMCLEALTPEAKELMEMMALLNGSFISMDIVKGLRKNMTDVSLISLLSDLRSADFIDVSTHGVIINRSFQALSQRLCVDKEKRQYAVSNTLTEAYSRSPDNDTLMTNASQYIQKKELSQQRDVGIAKKVADRCEDLELIYEEYIMRSKQVEDAEAAQVAPEQLVTSYIDAACRYFRCKQERDGEKAFRDAMRAAGDNIALKVKVKTTYGKILYKQGGDYRIAARELMEAVALTQGMEEQICDKDMADLSMSFALVKMELKEDDIAQSFYQKALLLRRKDPKGAKELVQVLVNLAFFYQTSSLRNLDEAESLNMEALRKITDEKDRQIGVIYRNLSIIYGERAQQYARSRDNPFHAKKLEYLMKSLAFREKYHSCPRIDPEIAQIFLSLADVYINQLSWNQAIDYLTKSKDKFGQTDSMYLKVQKKIEAVTFYRDHPEIHANREN